MTTIRKLPVEELRAAIPKDLVTARPAVTDAANGWTLAVGAAKGMKMPASNLLAGSFNDAKARTEARAALKAEEGRLRTLDAALSKPIWLQPRPQGPVTLFPEYAGLRMVQKTLALRARLAMGEGRSANAVDDLRRMVALADRFGDSHGMVISYLVYVALAAIGERAIQREAWAPAATATDLNRLLAVVPLRSGDPELEAALKEELAGYFVPMVAQFSSGGAQSSEKRDPVERILAGHPAPLDKPATIRLYAEAIRPLLASLSKPWAPRPNINGPLEALATGWPANLEDDDNPPTNEQIAKAREALTSVTNPLGRWLVASTFVIGESMRELSFKRRADRAATRITLLLRLYALAHGGVLPASLAELPESPPDPFTGRAFGYDPKRKVFWSAGPDGKDDGGDGKPGQPLTGKDYVWSAVGNYSTARRSTP